MKNKKCIGVKRYAGDPGRCEGERLHSTKYRGKKLYCEECLIYKLKQIASQSSIAIGF